jgi:hypothetical protein
VLLGKSDTYDQIRRGNGPIGSQRTYLERRLAAGCFVPDSWPGACVSADPATVFAIFEAVLLRNILLASVATRFDVFSLLAI